MTLQLRRLGYTGISESGKPYRHHLAASVNNCHLVKLDPSDLFSYPKDPLHS